MRIALAQILSTNEPYLNLELIRSETSRAAAKGARLIVFPEATMCAFGNNLREIAEPTTGLWANNVREIAAEFNVCIVTGMFTPGVGQRVKNTLLVVGLGIDTHYDKIHLYDAYGYQESETVTAGSGPVSFELEGSTIGLATCYDVRFPELFISNALAGARINIVCASWASGPGKRAQWQLAIRARAMDSTSYVIAVNQADPHSVHTDVPLGVPLGVGYSAVISPLGEVIGELDATPTTKIFEIDPEFVEEARAQLPVLANGKLR